MRYIITETVSGAVKVPVYQYNEIPYTDIMIAAPESKKRKGASYLEIPCAFDIETTNIYRRTPDGILDTKTMTPYAFMYHWQFCIGYRVVFGRTWEEFRKLLKAIEKNMNLSNKLRLVIYVHNLSFEMQFMRKFLNVTESFCKADRNPLKIVHNDCIEFRCSAALSNMKLSKFCEAEGARFYKLQDTFNYRKIRTPETRLTPEEESYCYNDVRGLSECILSLMRFDTLATIPMTNTGYVRRESRNSMRKNKKNRRIFKDSALSADEYRAFRMAFRGGDTHASARYADQVLYNVTSYDINSSYPACMMIDQFPITKFIPISLNTLRRTRSEEPGKFCYLIHAFFRDIKLKAAHDIPYIPLGKSKHYTSDRVLDNGRIRSASELTIWLTDIDMDIIDQEYNYSSIEIDQCYMAFAGSLPAEYKEVIMEYYRQKTQLKGLEDEESLYMYGKSKNKVNSLYGMMAMRIDQKTITYDGKSESGYHIPKDDETPLEEMLETYYKKRNNFLPYQWGVWVTAHARRRLHQMMNIIGRDLVYIDTDSVKFLHYERHKDQIDAMNRELKDQALQIGAYCTDREGKDHFLGVFSHDGSYDVFKTLGAKKYVTVSAGKCHSTIAGVSKAAGQKHFEKYGIDSFRPGEVIQESGHLIAFYNDDDIHTITIQGVEIETASNVALIDDTYTIGITDDYDDLIHELRHG